jgi:hypothetical protein
MGCLADSRLKLDTDPLPLTANGLSQIVHLRANDVVDCFARPVDVLTDRLSHVVDRKRIDELFAAVASCAITARRFVAGPACAIATAVCRPACSGRCTIAGPSRAFETCECSPLRALACSGEKRRDRAAATGTRPEHQSYYRANSSAKQSGCEQIELLVTLLVRIRLADGRAGAASPTRCRFQGICHPAPPPCQMLHEFRCALHARWTR